MNESYFHIYKYTVHHKIRHHRKFTKKRYNNRRKKLRYLLSDSDERQDNRSDFDTYRNKFQFRNGTNSNSEKISREIIGTTTVANSRKDLSLMSRYKNVHITTSESSLYNLSSPSFSV